MRPNQQSGCRHPARHVPFEPRLLCSYSNTVILRNNELECCVLGLAQLANQCIRCNRTPLAPAPPALPSSLRYMCKLDYCLYNHKMPVPAGKQYFYLEKACPPEPRFADWRIRYAVPAE